MTKDNIFDQLTQSTKEVDKLIDETTSKHDDELGSDSQYTSRKIKDTVQELLKYGLLESVAKPKLYQVAITNQSVINQTLEPLDLSLKIDDVRGLAFLVVLQNFVNDAHDEWSHPLIRKHRLNFEQSLLLAILREFYVIHELEAGIGNTQAVIALEDLIPKLRVFLGDPGSESKEDSRLRGLLEKLKSHGVVSEIDSRFNQVIVRPIITHLANPENLTAVLEVFKKKAIEEKAKSDTGEVV